MTPSMVLDPRRETEETLILLDHWVGAVQYATSVIRAEIARGTGERQEQGAHEDTDGER